MAIAKYQHNKPLDQIEIRRDKRQRKKLTQIEELAESISKIGLLQPIIIRREGNVLFAGERRLTAYKHLRDKHPEGPDAKDNPWTSIPFCYYDTLDEEEAQLVELEENVQRVELPWQERVEVTLIIHDILSSRDDNHTIAATARRLNLAQDTVSKHLLVAQALRNKDELVVAATTLSEAVNKIQRQLDRGLAAQMENLMAGSLGLNQVLAVATGSAPPPATGGGTAPENVHFPAPRLAPTGPGGPTAPTPQGTGPAPPTANVAAPPQPPFVNTDFLEWAASYSGPKFNFLHCDFPYGIDHQKSAQGRVASYGAYADEEAVYWKLLEGLAKNKHRLLFDSSHIMFWFSMNFYAETMKFFEVNFPEFTFDPFPLIWWKDRGIAPDVERRPRRVYEAALFGFSGGRKLVNTRANLVQAPCGNKIHASEKSAQMLRGFFRMFVDQHTKMLDPTCGSGTSVRAAKSLGAGSVLGIERDPNFFQEAVAAYQIAAATGFVSVKDDEDEK